MNDTVRGAALDCEKRSPFRTDVFLHCGCFACCFSLSRSLQNVLINFLTGIQNRHGLGAASHLSELLVIRKQIGHCVIQLLRRAWPSA